MTRCEIRALVVALSVATAACRREPPMAIADQGPRPAATCRAAEPAAGSESERRAAELIDTVGRARVSVAEAGDCLRSYTLETSAPLRDGQPKNPRRVVERAGALRVRTRNPWFDALHALALEEMRQLSVDSIRDDAFDEGEPLACPAGGCFETGRLWTYVWTRDTAYASHLALGALDPVRARNSLELKLSAPRGGGPLEIVQDTGSGGSWPVSTDRVVWALGARAVLRHLSGAEREAFARRALEALTTTLAADRRVGFDAHAGLYRGEQSFLDWREQSYPPWTANDTAPIAASLALSTNVGHLAALELAVELARDAGRLDAAKRWSGWARDLRRAIHETLWLEDEGLWSAFVLAPFDPAPVRRFDLLGTALAILHDVGPESAHRRAVARYPHLDAGAPVVWPAQPEPPIYHNRAIWPFVTAYWLAAARKVGNDAAADHAVRSLVRGAALNLSNMENFEMVSGAAQVDDGPRSGPVVNSQRQLWSVAGYLAMVHRTVFGIRAERDALRIDPYLTDGLRRSMFGDAATLVLEGYRWKGRTFSVVLRLPPPAAERNGAYRRGRLRVNGKPAEGGRIALEQLPEGALVEVELIDAPGEAATITRASPDERELFGPPTPSIAGIEARAGKLALSLSPFELDGAALRVWRDGAMIAELPATTRSYVDSERRDRDGPACYTLEAIYPSSGNSSQRARPVCWFGARGALVARAADKALEREGDRVVALLSPRRGGPHLVRLEAANGNGPINTGVGCAIRRLRVLEEASGREVAGGYALIPHGGIDAWDRFLPSTGVRAELEAGRRYRVIAERDPEAHNMSELAHFERYTGGRGGREGPVDRAEIRAIEALPLPR